MTGPSDAAVEAAAKATCPWCEELDEIPGEPIHGVRGGEG